MAPKDLSIVMVKPSSPNRAKACSGGTVMVKCMLHLSSFISMIRKSRSFLLIKSRLRVAQVNSRT